MIKKEEQLPLQARPLYAFRIRNGKLERKSFDRYGITQYGRKDIYRFVDATLKTKSTERLDKALNGYVYTFDPDPRHALELFRRRAESDMAKARADLRSAHASLDQAMSAARDFEHATRQEET